MLHCIYHAIAYVVLYQACIITFVVTLNAHQLPKGCLAERIQETP